MLRLAGASTIFAQRPEGPTADSTPTSTPGSIPQDTIHPALLQYIQAIRGGDANIQGSFDLPDIDPSNTNVIPGERSPSGYGPDLLTSSRVPQRTPDSTSDSVGAPPTQHPLPQVPADSQLWTSFESPQAPFIQGTPGGATYSLDSFSDFNSIFRFQSPFLHTQYPQFSAPRQTFEQTPTTGPSPASNDLSRGLGIGEMRIEDRTTGSGLDFTRSMAENVSELSSWEAFLAGWQP